MKIFENGKNWVIEDYLDDTLVREIKTIIEKNLDDILKKKEGTSTKGKNAEQYWLVNQNVNYWIKDKNFYAFEDVFKNQILNRLIAGNLFAERVKDNLDLKYLNSWTVIGDKHSYHSIHHHQEGDFNAISVVLYLNVPETNKKDELENDIYLVVNSEANNIYYDNRPSYLNINPEVGKLLIFPSWVLHGTYPQTNGIRQTFNIDYGFYFKEKKSNSNLLNYN